MQLPDPPKKHTAQRLLKTVGIPVATFLVGIGVGVAAAPDDEGTPVAAPAESPSESVDASDSPSPLPSPLPSPSPSPTPSPTPEPVSSEPEGKYELRSCDEQSAGNSYQLVGSTEVENGGEVDGTYEIEFTWLLGDGTKVEAEPKTITLAPDRTRLVFFRHPSDIDEVLNFQDHPDYFDSKNCRTRVSVS